MYGITMNNKALVAEAIHRAGERFYSGTDAAELRAISIAIAGSVPAPEVPAGDRLFQRPTWTEAGRYVRQASSLAEALSYGWPLKEHGQGCQALLAANVGSLVWDGNSFWERIR